MQKIVIVCGPTSSGKTALGLEVAKQINAEIISADSRQVYKELDIGTNKGELKEIDNQWYQSDIPIHLVNIRNPDERYSVYDFKNDCEQKIKEILEKGKNVLLVGGTGLYVDSIFRNYKLTENFNDIGRKEYENLNINELKKLYQEKYPEEYQNLNDSDQNNPRRLTMHLSKLDQDISLNGNIDLDNLNLSENDRKYLFIYPKFQRDELKTRIGKRVDDMFNEGLVEETKAAFEKYGKDSIALQGIGYKEVVELLEGKITETECKSFVKYAHNQYAKRQITWFEGTGRKYPLNRVSGIDDTMKLVKQFLKD